MVREAGEAFSFKKEKVGRNAGEPKGILGTVLNADGKTESLFVMNLSAENGEDGLELGHCGSIVGRAWLTGKWPL